MSRNITELGLDPDLVKKATSIMQMPVRIQIATREQMIRHTGSSAYGAHTVDNRGHRIVLLEGMKPLLANKVLWHELGHAHHYERDPRGYRSKQMATYKGHEYDPREAYAQRYQMDAPYRLYRPGGRA